MLYTLKGTVLKRRSLALLSERQFGYDILYLVLPPGLTKWCVFCCYQIIKFSMFVCLIFIKNFKISTVKLGDKELFGHPKIVP